MAKIPSFDFTAVEVSTLLNHRKRAEAIELVLSELAAGTAGPETQRLAASLLSGKRGRPATGRFAWYEIGKENEWMTAQGLQERDRIQRLAEMFRMGEKHIEACITDFNKAQGTSE